MDQQGSLAPDSPVLDGVKFTGTVQVQERAAEGPLTWSFSTEKAFVATLSSVGWGWGGTGTVTVVFFRPYPTYNLLL